jgi:predicted small integral membrane protein
MEALSILLPALGIAVIILMLVEVRQWRADRTGIPGRQMALRIAGGVIMLALLTAIFLGLYIPGLRSPAGRPVFFVAWWTGCLLAAIGLIVLALADMRRVERRQREREHALWREFARTLAERIRRERGQDQTDARDERG